MTTIITSKWRQYVANLFKNDIDDADVTKNLYFFIGKPTEWDVDVAPPAPTDTVAKQLRVWDEMLALKKIKEVDVVFVIPRHDWDSSGDTVYVPYKDDDANLFYHPTDAEILAGQLAGTPYTAGSFYVMTDEYHVFKCLSNNNGVKSTSKPTKPLSSPYIHQGADGYRWKYMFTIPTNEVENYLTDAWIPVKTLTADDGTDQWDVQQDAAGDAGSILQTLVINGGSNYTNVQDSDPENPDVQTAQGGGATTITLSAAASGVNNAYVNATVWITNGTGSGQYKKITSYVGSTKVATVESAWSTNPDNTSDYQILPTIELTGDGTGAVAKPVVVGGVITRVDMVETGADYDYVTATVTGGGGSGASVAPQLPPNRTNHGADPVLELGGNYVMLRVSLEYDEGSGDFFVTNDYRITGLIRNVKDSGGDIATADTMIGVPKLNLSSVSGTFLPDEPISGGTSGKTAFVVQPEDLGSGNGSLTFIKDLSNNVADFSLGETITGTLSGATAVLDSITVAEVEEYSGELLAVEHRRPITRAPNQKETLKYVLNF